MQALTQVAAQLLRENWSIVEDLFQAAAATVHHLKKRSQPCAPEAPNPKPSLVPPCESLTTPPKTRTGTAVSSAPMPIATKCA